MAGNTAAGSSTKASTTSPARNFPATSAPSPSGRDIANSRPRSSCPADQARIASAGTNTTAAQGRNSVKSRTDASLVERNSPTAKIATFTLSTIPSAST